MTKQITAARLKTHSPLLMLIPALKHKVTFDHNGIARHET